MLLCGLASLFNFSVFFVAWDFLGVFRNSMPPRLGIMVISLSLVALLATLGATRKPRGKTGLHLTIVAVACAASLLTVSGELLVLNSEDGNFAIALMPATGTLLHVLAGAILSRHLGHAAALPDRVNQQN
ncbi:hypothetical protein BJH93_07555 [Kocuria polaris]|nr:hypothetical protein [Kocuria polaris]